MYSTSVTYILFVNEYIFNFMHFKVRFLPQQLCWTVTMLVVVFFLLKGTMLV